MAFIQAVQGERESAYRSLDSAVERGFRDYQRALAEPYFESLRGEPRFQQLVGRIRADVERMKERVEREGW